MPLLLLAHTVHAKTYSVPSLSTEGHQKEHFNDETIQLTLGWHANLAVWTKQITCKCTEAQHTWGDGCRVRASLEPADNYWDRASGLTFRELEQ